MKLMSSLLNKIKKEGRQKTGYTVYTLLNSTKLKCDLHFIVYDKGNYIPPHKDRLDGEYDHYRLNIILKKPESGGKFSGNTLCNFRGRIILFRPDISEHSVSEITSGKRIVLSFGKAIKRNK